MDRTMKVQIALPFLVIMAALLSVKIINLKPALNSGEMRMLQFIPESVNLSEKLPVAINLKGSQDVIKQQQQAEKDFPPVPLSAVAPPPSKEAGGSMEPAVQFKISMIVVGDGRRMAIVNGGVVREGDAAGGMRIARIEKDRILFVERTTKNRQWVALEGAK